MNELFLTAQLSSDGGLYGGVGLGPWDMTSCMSNKTSIDRFSHSFVIKILPNILPSIFFIPIYFLPVDPSLIEFELSSSSRERIPHERLSEATYLKILYKTALQLSMASLFKFIV